MRIGIGNDRTAIEYKNKICQYLVSNGHEVIDYGVNEGEVCDYPIVGKKVANAVIKEEITKGIVICGNGVGIGLAANKVKGIRCVTCSEPLTAKTSVEHNNTNMLSFGVKIVNIEMAIMIVDAWLESKYEEGHHQRRLDMLE
ncbi:MAG: ribose 5-phosphate isomerase B [Coprobacillaceae bacterium]